MFDSKDSNTLSKLHVQTLLDLALITPHSYEDNTLSNPIVPDVINTIEVVVANAQRMPKFLKVTAQCVTCQSPIEIIYFSYTPYHLKTFSSGAKLYLKGRIERKFTLTMIQPKILKEVNTIEVKYKTSLKNEVVRKMMDRYIHPQAFEMLPTEVARQLDQIHHPSLPFVKAFNLTHTFDQPTIYALKYSELFNYLHRLSAKRLDHQANRTLEGNPQPFVDSLPFGLTDDQKEALANIQADLAKPVSSKRVIMGDVGSGKTVLILASAMIAYPSRSVLMAPTTILANQIYEEATKLLPKEVRVTLVTNKAKKEDLSRYDFIIGTHALLHRELPSFDLVMIDEQHRFGTKQRYLLESVGATETTRPHFLQFTATPIPRTMAMIESNFVDYSFLRQTPFVKDIDTLVIRKEEFQPLIEHIKAEVANEHQVIIVYPLVEESEAINYQSLEEARGYWESNFDRVYVTHGKDKEKEQIIEQFREQGSILLSTTVVEVGISLPRLTTIVIVGAERLGFASLHQLRGRVSRNGLKGYCYLFTKTKESERLEEFAKTTNGFEIAELDLQYREGGDLLSGNIQSGREFKWVDLSQDEALIAQVKEKFNTISS